jgi:hypothetical protein
VAERSSEILRLASEIDGAAMIRVVGGFGSFGGRFGFVDAFFFTNGCAS